MSFTITGHIGKGKFGDIYSGSFGRTREIVAIKQEHQPVLLKHETQVLYYLHRHGCPCIPSVYWFGPIHGRPTLVMTWMERPISSIDIQNLNDYWKQLIYALQYMHSVDILHRDIKPSNCMISKNRVYFVDFGLSNTIESIDVQGETIVGTPPFISIHVHEGHCPSRRDDLLSLGYTFLSLLGQWSTDDVDIPHDERVSLASIFHPHNQWWLMKKRREREMSTNVFMKKCYLLSFDSIPNYDDLCRE
jgi:serine/threonine protein kinase